MLVKMLKIMDGPLHNNSILFAALNNGNIASNLGGMCTGALIKSSPDISTSGWSGP